MKQLFLAFSVLLLGCSTFCLATDKDEISLFDSTGSATAYIAEDMTIYLWSGTPVAYLYKDDAGGFHIYGFNGKHLGWFVGGIARDHKGNAIGGVKKAFVTATKPAPFKSFKTFAPFRPSFTRKWSETSFKLFLLQGASK